MASEKLATKDLLLADSALSSFSSLNNALASSYSFVVSCLSVNLWVRGSFVGMSDGQCYISVELNVPFVAPLHFTMVLCDMFEFAKGCLHRNM